ncbi:condensation domain-containing protein, partial [Massilia scottii]|uniref:condensation domain-containing protein n=1 Tax=Massilia scottii TaxID=3057166 RepID=UPI002796A516
MTAQKLLDLLKAKSIVLELKGEGLSYSGPKEAVSSELLELIRAHKTELIVILTAARGGQGIVALERSGRRESSFSQQRLWFLNELDPAAGAAYFIFDGVRLSGLLDRAVLQAALDRIVARHDVLRASFTCDDGTVFQACNPCGVPFELSFTDLRGCPDDVREQAIALAHEGETRRGFDLAAGPLIRAQLLCFAADEHVLLLTQHHIVSDGWSIGVLIHELNALYTAFCKNLPDPLPALAIQYADYAVWQRKLLRGDTLQRQVDFWRSHLSGAPALLELPTDRPRSAEQSYHGGRVPVR